MRRIRSWLIIRLKGTNKVIILKRSKSSRNSNQWDFVGGSHTNTKGQKRINPRKLIRKESREEIGFTPLYTTTKLVVVDKKSTYYYYLTTISRKQLETLRLSKEHKDIKLVNLHKLHKVKNKHHSISIFLKHR